MENVESERLRRQKKWEEVLALGGPDGLNATIDIRSNLQILKGYTGIFRDKEHTESLDSAGVTLGLQHTGSSYSDDLTEKTLLYHYPKTSNRAESYDVNEIRATKNAFKFQLPIFVIVNNGKFRNVRLGWIKKWDDEQEVFFMDLCEEWVSSPPSASAWDEPAGDPTARKQREIKTSEGKERDHTFAPRVKNYYGTRCAMCHIVKSELIQGAHLISVKENGSDLVGNGIPLCANHHLAMDRGLVAVDPDSMEIVMGEEIGEIGITQNDILHLKEVPEVECLRFVWEKVFISKDEI